MPARWEGSPTARIGAWPTTTLPRLPRPLTHGGVTRGAGDYEDVAGFCKSATLEKIRSYGHVLTLGRYVGAEEAEDDGEPFEDKMKRLVGELGEQFAASARLETAIAANLASVGCPIYANGCSRE